MFGTQGKLLAIACLLIALLAAGLALAFSLQISGELAHQFNVRAELFARTFADQVQFRLLSVAQGDDPQMTAKALIQPVVEDRVRGEVIYAQVVKDGVVLGEERTYVVEQTQLEVTPLDEPLVKSQHTLSSGTPYLDVRRALVISPNPVDPVSYIRLGFSMMSLQHDMLNRVLQTAGWSLLGTVVGMGLLVLLFRQGQLDRAPAMVAQPAAPPSVRNNGQAPVVAQQQALRTASIIRCGDLIINDEAKSVLLKNEQVALSPREYELLKLLGTHPGKIFSNEEIVERVWSDDQFAIPQDVKKYIYLLRKKLEEDSSHPKRLLTVRGFGYKLVDSATLTSFDSP